MPTGQVVYRGYATAGYHPVYRDASQTNWSLTREGSFPTAPYRVYNVTAVFDISIRGAPGGDTLTFRANNATTVGTWVAGQAGTIYINFTNNYDYSQLASMYVYTDEFMGTNFIGYADDPVITIYVNWEETTSACSAPTEVTVGSTLTGDSTVLLSWSGASGGTNNAITGYGIQYQDSTDGSTWGAWTALSTVPGTSGSGSTQAATNTNPGNYRRYRVQTQGSAGADYYSGYTVSPAVQRFGKCTPPTSIAPSSSMPPLGELFYLNWSGAKAANGDTIAGYAVYRSLTEDGTYTQIGTVQSTTGSGSFGTEAPDETGESYFYKVITLSATGAAFNSEFSAVVEVTGGYGRCTAPGSVMAFPQAAKPGGASTIVWSDGAGGTGNAVAGYQIMRSTSLNGTYTDIGSVSEQTNFFGELRWCFSTVAPANNDAVYYYKVKTMGEMQGYDSFMSESTASVTANADISSLVSAGITNAMVR